jgi:Tfp pilus assembly protein PilX
MSGDIDRDTSHAVIDVRVTNLEKALGELARSSVETQQAVTSISVSIAKLVSLDEKMDERHIDNKAAFERAFDKIVEIEKRIETKCTERDNEMKVVATEMAHWTLVKPNIAYVIKEMPETVKVRDWIIKGAVSVIGIIFISLLALVVHLK